MPAQNIIQGILITQAGGSAGGAGAPTFTAPETEQRADAFALNPLLLQDESARSDLFALNPLTLNEALSRLDAFLLPTIDLTAPETVQRSDPGTLAVGPIQAQARLAGNRVVDSSSFGHDGQKVGAPTLSAGTAGFGNRVNTSDGNYISVTPSSDFDFNRTNMTIEARIRTSAGEVFLGVIDAAAASGGQWDMGITPSGTVLFLYIDSSGGFQILSSSSTGFKDGNEHVLRLTKSGNSLVLFVDGTSVATHTVASGIKAMPSVPLTIGDLPGPFAAGAGSIDEVRISDIVRSDSTSSPFTSDANTLALYHFEDDWTADGDDWGDGWTNNTVGQTGVNHGNETPLNIAAGVAGVGVELAFVAVNLKRFTGCTAVGGVHTITGVFTNGSLLVASTITLRGGPSALGGGATRPFTESTITQANQPAAPTGFVLTANLPAAAVDTLLTFTLNDAQLQTVLGKWATLRFESSGATTTNPDRLVSREGAAANKMGITFKVQV